MRPFSEMHLPVLSGNPWPGDSTLRASGAKTRRTSAPSTFRLNESQASSSNNLYNVYIYIYIYIDLKNLSILLKKKI